MGKNNRIIFAGLIPVFVLGFVSHMVPYVYIPSLPEIAENFSWTRSDTTNLMTSYYFSMAITLLFVGMVGDKWDKKLLLTSAAVIIFIGSVSASVVSLFWLVLSGWSLQGIGSGIITVVTMARPKKQPKIKEPIRLRTKTLANGNKSLYLDMYQHGKREYLFLRLYLIPETDQAAKVMNQNTLQAANAIKAQKIIELSNNAAGLSSAGARSKIKLSDWLDQYRDIVKARNPDSSYHQRLTALKHHLECYDANIMLRGVDKSFCEGFINHMLTTPANFSEKPMKRSTAQSYLMVLNAALNVAVREEMMRSNPLLNIAPSDKPHAAQSMREYLTVDEVKALMATPCSPKRQTTKMAFLFSCFCGLRYSDIAALTWGNIEESNGQCTAKIVVKKTSQPLYVPLSAEALRWMPERGTAADTDKIFPLPGYHAVRSQLKKWLESADVKKHITFHVGRHTFATLMLTLGADLYTTSKLLGHSKVTTTQIYAKIVDAKKVEAVNLVNNIFGDTGKEVEE